METKKRPHLLIVDDEASIRDLFKLWFTRQGFDATTVEGVTTAEEALRNGKFDLAILDINLEDGDGLELMGRLKVAYPAMPILILTGLGFEEELLRKAQKLGARGFISKTLPFGQVLMEVRHALAPPKDGPG